MLRDIGQHGIGAAEGHEGGLGEQDRHVEERLRPEHREAGADGQGEQHQIEGRDPREPGPEARKGSAIHMLRGGADAARVCRSRQEGRRAATAGEPAQRAGGEDDPGEIDPQREKRDERAEREAPGGPSMQGLAADAPDGMRDDRHDHGLQAVEDRGHGGQVPTRRQDPGQQQQNKRAGKHEERSRRDAAAHPVQAPSRIGRELLGFRSGQEGAEIETAQEDALVDPAQAIHQFGLHHRDLSGGATEAEAAKFRPETQRLREGGRRRRRRAFGQRNLTATTS